MLNSQVDGVLGLGRSKPFKSGSLVNINRGASFVEALYAAGELASKTFSFHMTVPEVVDPDSPLIVSQRANVINFGDPDVRVMRNADDLRYIKLHDDLFWAASCRGFAFGSLDIDYRVPDLGSDYTGAGEMKAIFDSASSTIQMPIDLFDMYFEALIVSIGSEVSE